MTSEGLRACPDRREGMTSFQRFFSILLNTVALTGMKSHELSLEQRSSFRARGAFLNEGKPTVGETLIAAACWHRADGRDGRIAGRQGRRGGGGVVACGHFVPLATAQLSGVFEENELSRDCGASPRAPCCPWSVRRAGDAGG
jgi:hypothetical protein